jgi:hypothetical protein
LKPGASAAAAREVMDLARHVFKQIMYPGPLRLPEIYEKNGMETIALDIFANDVNPQYRRNHTVMFIKSGCQFMLQRMVKENKLAAERAEELMKKAIEEVESGDLYLHSEMYFIVGKKLER